MAVEKTFPFYIEIAQFQFNVKKTSTFGPFYFKIA